MSAHHDTVAIVADLHYTNPKIHPGEMHNGISARLRGMLDVLEGVVTTHDVNHLIVAGDIFDSSHPSHVVTHYVMERLHKGRLASCRVYAMKGNHDADSTAPADHVLAPLAFSEGLTAVEFPTSLFGHFWLLPWGYSHRSGSPAKGAKVVVAHHGIWDDSTPSFMRSVKDAVPAAELLAWMDQHGVSHYFAGDWHEHKRYHGDRVVQIGALTPQDWRNPGIHGYGTVVLFHLNRATGAWSGPTFVTAAGTRFVTAESVADLPRLPPGCRGYARVKQGGVTPAGYVVVEEAADDARVEQVERAAVDVSSFENLGVSLESWVLQAASIPEEDRPEVYRRAMAFLEKGVA